MNSESTPILLSATCYSGRFSLPPQFTEAVLIRWPGWGGALRHGSGHHGLWRRSCRVIGEPLEVLDGGGQQELVPGAGEAPQSEANHREDMLGLAKEHLDLLALAAGDPIGLGFHYSAGVIA